MKRTASLLTFSVLLMLLVFSNHADVRVQANSIPLISFSEFSCLVAVNKPFNVTVMVEDVTDLAAWQIGIDFDPSALQYVAATAPSDNIFGSRLTILRSTDYLSEGLVVIGGVRLAFDPTFTGSGKLITITFIMNTTSSTALVFDTSGISPVLHFNTMLINGGNGEMAYSAVGCSIHCVQYLPDINNDGIVDTKDIMGAVIAFNSFPSSSNWNVYADVDNNGHVDLRDIVSIVANFGMHTSGTPSGGIPGMEELEFTSVYAETVADGWNVHVVIKNTGSAAMMFDNTTAYVNDPLPVYPVYTPVANFGQVTLQPGDTTEVQFMLPSGIGSPWHSGLEIIIVIATASGGWYTTWRDRVIYLP